MVVVPIVDLGGTELYLFPCAVALDYCHNECKNKILS